MANIQTLSNKRRVLKSNLTRASNTFKKLLEAEPTQTNLKLIENRLTKFLPLYDNFTSVMDEIESLSEPNEDNDDSNIDNLNAERDEFESIFLLLKIEIDTYLSNIKSAQSSSVSNSSNTNTNSSFNVKLPTLNLPVFSGKYEEWSAFFETFSSLIHTNTSLDSIQKFHYLRSCLKGDALNTIKSLESIASNYNVALDLLKNRFENKLFAIDKHVESLFNISVITKESASSLRALHDTVCSNLRSLNNLGEPVDHWGTVLIHLINIKVDPITRREWKTLINSDHVYSFQKFIHFIKKRCDLLESLERQTGNVNSGVTYKKENSNSKHIFTSHLTTNKPRCSICAGEHIILYCDKFLKMQPKERLSKVQSASLCVNCLRSNHITKQCKSPTNCKICYQRHHTLLHLMKKIPESIVSQNSEPGTTTSNNYHTVALKSQTLLSTACVSVIDNKGIHHQCRALLDSGSQSCFVTKKFADQLDVIFDPSNTIISGVSKQLTNITNKIRIQIKSNHTSFKTHVNCLVLNNITNDLPQSFIDIQQLKIPQHIKLADPSFNKPSEIDMLLGANLFWELICNDKITLGKYNPVLQSTKLGWIVTGNISSPNSYYKHCNVSTVEEQIEKFWNIEEITEKNLYTRDELLCEQNFVDTTRRSIDGKFIVTMPLNNTTCDLMNSRNLALKRFSSLENKFLRDPQTASLYKNFMQEYETLGHMTECLETFPLENLTFYLPHHPVIKQSSKTTKLRVVFDGSAKGANKQSLNDIQRVGPTIQNDVFSVLVRFRQHAIVITADIKQMYRQIWISEEHKSLQRIFWRENTNQPIKCYQLNTVTYGTASAPFLAIRSLIQLAYDNEINFPSIAKIIKDDFYVDDMLTGGDSLEEVKTIKTNVIDILKGAGFILHKWVSNEPSLMQDSQDSINNASEQLTDSSINKSLGVSWDHRLDKFIYNHNLSLFNLKITKRNILSTIAKIYDPLGLIAPVIIEAKLIMQELWQQNVNWDESLPLNISSKWINFIQNLENINKLNIPRRVVCKNFKHIELHGFCDASEAAYGACVYLKTVDDTGLACVRLICAKSKVAPLKRSSLPRLELCGALLLSKLFSRLKNIFDFTIQNVYFWCDSTITLHWIKGPCNKWKTFVANRVAMIQRSTDTNDWLHIRTHENPADLITRGVSPLTLSTSDVWWNGPSWLLTGNEYTDMKPSNLPDIETSDNLEIRHVNFVISQFVALALASLFRTVLHPSKTKSATRHGFGLIFGLIIGYFCFGMQAIHLAGLPALCYIVIRTTNPQIMQRMVLAVALIYLSCIHLHRQVYDYGSYTLDITGPLMVVTQKVTSLAFSIHDGLYRKEAELTKSQILYAVKKMPTPLEYFSYALQFPTLMAGPALFYKDYIDFIDGNNFSSAPSGKLNNNTGSNTVILEPSPVGAVCKKVTLSLLCAMAFVKFLPTFHIEGVKDDDFVENTTLMYKFWYLSVATMLVRFKYYFAWLFADATCNNSGLGFQGNYPDGSYNWDKFSNINIVKFEFGKSMKECIEAWNIGTNSWLRMIVYERVDKYATVLTYALSALWHGFYPGYYLTFTNGAVFTFAARIMRRTIRDYFTGNTELKFFYDVITFILTRLVMAYITFTFVLLEFWAGVRLYLHMYLCLHVLALIALFLVPRIVPKARPGDSTHLTANGSIASVLKQASPITNSVSNHHD